MYRGMLGLNGAGFSDALLWQVTPQPVVVPWPRRLAGLRAAAAARPAAGRGRGAGLVQGGPLLGFLVAMVALYSRAAVPFLYFQF